jgi:adenylate cyclase
LRKRFARIVIGFAVVLVFLGHAAGYYSLPLLANLEAIVYDTRLRLTMPGTVDTRIAILNIDEKSLAEKEDGGEGHWPWPRHRLALLLDKLFEKYGVAIVGFDVVFAERDESSGIRVLERLGEQELRHVPEFHAALKQVKPRLQYDDIFARKMQGRRVVLGYVFSNAETGRVQKKGMLPQPAFPRGAFAKRPIYTTSWNAYTANLEELQKSAASAGHFNSITDDDGIVRRVPMLLEYDGAYYEPLSLAMVRTLFDLRTIRAVLPGEAYTSRHYAGLEWLQVGSMRIPLDETASALVPYRGGQGSFNYFSLVDILNERINPAELKGKIALVGATAPGLLDLRATPVGPIYPGVEIHANLIAGILDGVIKQRPPYVLAAEFMLLLVSGVAIALLLPFLSPLVSTVATVIMLALVVATNVAVFDYGNVVLPLASGLLMILILFTFNMGYGFFVEARGRQKITSLFGQYVPPELVDQMAQNSERFNMAPRAQELSVLFSDVRGFTTISESLSPEDLAAYINEYLTTMSLVIREEHGGTLDKYIGDAIMAFWGAPVADPEHARKAVLAALGMQREARALNEKFKAKGWPTFKIGIGVNSGVMRVGDMGSQIRRAYTVMGDAVNLGSRLEGITKEYGADIIIGEGTKNLLSGFALRELDRVRVKGKDEPVTIYEPLGLEAGLDQPKLNEIDIWDQVLKSYRAQDWDMAEQRLLKLRKTGGNAELYDLFLARTSAFRKDPPGPAWDGVYTFEAK